MKEFIKIFPGLKEFYDLNSDLCEEAYQDVLREKDRLLKKWCEVQMNDDYTVAIDPFDIDYMRIRVIEDEKCDCPYFCEVDQELLDEIEEDTMGERVFLSREMYLEIMQVLCCYKPTVEENDSYMKQFVEALFILAGEHPHQERWEKKTNTGEKNQMYVTGDIHKEMARFWAPGYGINPTLNEGDLLFICGDFGFAGMEEDLDALEEFPYMIAFCDGNHENFPALNRYPVETWNGGNIHRLRKNVIHLMRGEVYTVNGKKIFVMGGGYSMDRPFYKEGVHWWQEEMPSEEEMDRARVNLEKHDHQVDYIITHTAPEDTIHIFHDGHEGERKLNFFLEWIRENVSYKHWYFGHLHQDRELWRDQTAIWTDLRVLETGEVVSFL